MRQAISFIGEGPSPREVDVFYQLDEMPPEFAERYEGEFAYMYQANGYKQLCGVFVPEESELTLRQLAMRLYPYVFQESKLLFGPLVIEERVVVGGFSWWRQGPRQWHMSCRGRIG